MIILVIGIVCLLIGSAFFWLNLNSPIQTPLPAIFVPVGAGAVIFAVARLLP